MGLSQFQDDLGADLHLCGLGTRLYICDLDGGLQGLKVLRAAPGVARSIKINKKKKERSMHLWNLFGTLWKQVETSLVSKPVLLRGLADCHWH